jgi:hypothetical protein
VITPKMEEGSTDSAICVLKTYPRVSRSHRLPNGLSVGYLQTLGGECLGSFVFAMQTGTC